MKIIKDKIYLTELLEMSKKMHQMLVKAVVDIEQQIMVVDAELHADEEELLLEHGSNQESLWGINLYPHKINSDNWIEFDSMINLRPSWGNSSRSVEDVKIQQKILTTVNKLVIK